MNKKKITLETNFEVTEEQMDSLARVLFSSVYDYLSNQRAENETNNEKNCA